MGRLSFTGLTSLDGYINDVSGNFDWAVPSDEVHAFVNDLERSIGTRIMGRRLYETMAAWETMPPTSPVMDDFAAIWRGSDKVVISTSLSTVSSTHTALHRSFSPELVTELTRTQDVSIGGPGLAAQAFDLIDDVHLFLTPVVVGGGTRFFPADASARLTLADSRVFSTGVVHLHYRRD